MKEYAIVDDGNFIEFKNFEEVPVLPGKPYRSFYEVLRETGTPAYEGIEDGKWVVRTEPQPIQIPQSVSARQARLALLQANLLSTVTASVTSMPEEVQITWEYATEWYRTDPLVISIGSSLGLSNTQMDELFLTASTL